MGGAGVAIRVPIGAPATPETFKSTIGDAMPREMNARPAFATSSDPNLHALQLLPGSVKANSTERPLGFEFQVTPGFADWTKM